MVAYPGTAVRYGPSTYNTNCPSTSHSIGGFCFLLGSDIISWASHKHPYTANLSTYTEYISLHDASHKVLFLWQLLDSLHFSIDGPTQLYYNNDMAWQLTKDQQWHSKVRHFQVKYHTIRDLVNLDKLVVISIHSPNNITDILTKPLGHTNFEHLCHYLGLHSLCVL